MVRFLINGALLAAFVVAVSAAPSYAKPPDLPADGEVRCPECARCEESQCDDEALHAESFFRRVRETTVPLGLVHEQTY